MPRVMRGIVERFHLREAGTVDEHQAECRGSERREYRERAAP